ncbi:MAG: flagellin, partial [Alphaproteobacteria bacterium]
MAFSVNTNQGALVALQSLSQTNQSLSTTQNRINTGFKVAGAADGAAVFAIAQNLRADVGGLNAVQQSLDRSISVVDVALNAAETISDLLVSLREK